MKPRNAAPPSSRYSWSPFFRPRSRMLGGVDRLAHRCIHARVENIEEFRTSGTSLRRAMRRSLTQRQKSDCADPLV
jgi:hypothetical protein